MQSSAISTGGGSNPQFLTHKPGTMPVPDYRREKAHKSVVIRFSYKPGDGTLVATGRSASRSIPFNQGATS